MSAQKARLILKVERLEGDVMVSVRDPYRENLETLEPLESLSRLEVIRAALNVGLSTSRADSVEALRLRIEAAVTAPGYTPRVWEPAPRAEHHPDFVMVPTASTTGIPPRTVEGVAVAPGIPQSVEQASAAITSILLDLETARGGGASTERLEHLESRLESLEVYRSSLERLLLEPRLDNLESAGFAFIERAELIEATTDRTRADLERLDDAFSSTSLDLRTRLEALEVERPRPVVVSVKEVEVGRVEGRSHRVLPDVIGMLLAGIHPFMYGPAGTGKTTIAEQAATALNARAFEALSLTPGMGVHDVFGLIDAMGVYRGTPFRDVFEHGGVFLADEIDNGPSEITAGLNAALANGWAAFPDGRIKRHPEFRLIAAGNTQGTGPSTVFIGRAALDVATLDRFSHSFVEIDLDLERSILESHYGGNLEAALEWHRTIQAMRANAERHRIFEVSLSPRRAFDFAKMRSLLEWTSSKALEAAIWRGAPEALRVKILENVSVR